MGIDPFHFIVEGDKGFHHHGVSAHSYYLANLFGRHDINHQETNANAPFHVEFLSRLASKLPVRKNSRAAKKRSFREKHKLMAQGVEEDEDAAPEEEKEEPAAPAPKKRKSTRKTKK